MAKNANKSFWQRNARLYDPFMSSQDKIYKAIVKGIRPVLKDSNDVLELACGTGKISMELSPYVHFWEATDFSENMIAQAKKQPHISKLHFSVQDAFSLPYAESTFDVVVIANGLHVMPEPEKAMAEIRRVLKPGGLLFAPNFVEGGTRLVQVKLFILRVLGMKVYSKWDAKGYVAFIKSCGFNIVEAHKIITHKSPPVCFVTGQ